MPGVLERLYPDIFYYELTEGGMHIVAFLRKGIQDVQLAAFWSGLFVAVMAGDQILTPRDIAAH